MDLFYEYKLTQNPVLGATSIGQCVTEYYKTKKEKEGMPLILSMLVLPITFHIKTAKNIAHRNLAGGFYKALYEDRAIPVGLQKRMEDMALLTFRSINLAINTKKYIRYQDGQIIPERKTFNVDSFGYEEENTKEIISAAKRLGYWFATSKFEQVCELLNVRF